MRVVAATMVMLGVLVGCASAPPTATEAPDVGPVADPRWDAGDFEILTWDSSIPSNRENRA